MVFKPVKAMILSNLSLSISMVVLMISHTAVQTRQYGPYCKCQVPCAHSQRSGVRKAGGSTAISPESCESHEHYHRSTRGDWGANPRHRLRDELAASAPPRALLARADGRALVVNAGRCVLSDLRNMSGSQMGVAALYPRLMAAKPLA